MYAGGAALGCFYSTQKGARILFFFFFWDLGLLSAILIAQSFIAQDKDLWAPSLASSLTTSHLSSVPSHPPAIVRTHIPFCVLWLSAFVPVTLLTSSFLLVLLLNVSHTSRHGCSLWGIKSVLLVQSVCRLSPQWETCNSAFWLSNFMATESGNHKPVFYVSHFSFYFSTNSFLLHCRSSMSTRDWFLDSHRHWRLQMLKSLI